MGPILRPALRDSSGRKGHPQRASGKSAKKEIWRLLHALYAFLVNLGRTRTAQATFCHQKDNKTMNFAMKKTSKSLCLFAASLAGLFGCTSIQASGGGSSDNISGPPTFNQTYQSRNPRVCAKMMNPPNAAQAAALVQCSTESDTSGSMTPLITLLTDVEVEIGAPRDFILGPDNRSDIDPKAKVYPIRGKGTMWQCFPAAGYPAGQNCLTYPAAAGGQGTCYKTTFGDWTCRMSTGGPRQIRGQKGPTTY